MLRSWRSFFVVMGQRAGTLVGSGSATLATGELDMSKPFELCASQATAALIASISGRVFTVCAPPHRRRVRHALLWLTAEPTIRVEVMRACQFGSGALRSF